MVILPSTTIIARSSSGLGLRLCSRTFMRISGCVQAQEHEHEQQHAQVSVQHPCTESLVDPAAAHYAAVHM